MDSHGFRGASRAYGNKDVAQNGNDMGIGINVIGMRMVTVHVAVSHVAASLTLTLTTVSYTHLTLPTNREV